MLARDVVEWGAAGGEDYELLLTCDPAAAGPLAEGLEQATGTPLTVIGEIDAVTERLAFVDSRGESVPMRAGYEHFVE